MQDCDNDTTIKDETGNKELPLKTVFRESIGYLKEHALDFCTLTENDVLWVLTLPAIWSESQKEMMRSAAIEVSNFDCVVVRFRADCSMFFIHFLISKILKNI